VFLAEIGGGGTVVSAGTSNRAAIIRRRSPGWSWSVSDGHDVRIYCLRQWYNRSDPGAEEAAVRYPFDALVLHLELGHDPIPEETTILCFRHLL
jgi:hypothetical protein